MTLSNFKLLRPRTVEEAVSLLAKHAGDGARATRVIAGGTDLIPSMRQKLFEPENVIDIRHIAELKGIRETEQGTEIGALTTLSSVERSANLKQRYPVLVEAAKTVASPVIRNMATLGGNICLDTRCLWYNQSLTWRKSCGFCIKKDGDLCHVAPGGKKCWAAFSGDTPAALLCVDAEIELASSQGTRRLPLSEFYTGEGDNYRRLECNELLTRVILPKAASGLRGTYRKLRVRGSIDYPLAGVAVTMKRSNGDIELASIALTAVNPAPVLLTKTSEALQGKRLDEELAEFVGDLAAKTAKPLTTSALTPEYRREMIRVLTKRALLELAKN